MKVLCLDNSENTAAAAKQAAQALRGGQIIAYPTDTIYGLGCVADNAKAVNRIYQMKQRSYTKPPIVLLSDLEILRYYCYLTPVQEKYLYRVWPWLFGRDRDFAGYQPTTVLLHARCELPWPVVGQDQTLAVRIPRAIGDFELTLNQSRAVGSRQSPQPTGLSNRDFLIKMLAEARKPVVATSLNVSGCKVVKRLDCTRSELPQQIKPDLEVAAGINHRTKPSRLLDIRDPQKIQVIRS